MLWNTRLGSARPASPSARCDCVKQYVWRSVARQLVIRVHALHLLHNTKGRICFHKALLVKPRRHFLVEKECFQVRTLLATVEVLAGVLCHPDRLVVRLMPVLHVFLEGSYIGIVVVDGHGVNGVPDIRALLTEIVHPFLAAWGISCRGRNHVKVVVMLERHDIFTHKIAGIAHAHVGLAFLVDLVHSQNAFITILLGVGVVQHIFTERVDMFVSPEHGAKSNI